MVADLREPLGHEACGTTTGYDPRPLDALIRKPWHRITNPEMARVRKNTAVRLPHMHGERLLIEGGRVAMLGFDLQVWQWLPEHVGSHSTHSYHKQHYPDGIGKAYDAFGLLQHEYADYMNEYAPQLNELIFNCCDSRKNGVHEPPSFWGSAVWDEHRNHAHVANDGPALTVREHHDLIDTLKLLGLA